MVKCQIFCDFDIYVRYKHEISLVSYAKPDQMMDVVRYNREFVITVIFITEFDCITKTFVEEEKYLLLYNN